MYGLCQRYLARKNYSREGLSYYYLRLVVAVCGCFGCLATTTWSERGPKCERRYLPTNGWNSTKSTPTGRSCTWALQVDDVIGPDVRSAKLVGRHSAMSSYVCSPTLGAVRRAGNDA